MNNAQVPECLIHQGEVYAMTCEPLGAYFERVGHTPSFLADPTSPWRGYVGDWELVDGRLYLVKIRARYEDGDPVRLSDLFPGFHDRVFAHWFSGDVRVPRGELLDAVHAGHTSLYERDLFFRMDCGVVARSWVCQNSKSRLSPPVNDDKPKKGVRSFPRIEPAFHFPGDHT